MVDVLFMLQDSWCFDCWGNFDTLKNLIISALLILFILPISDFCVFRYCTILSIWYMDTGDTAQSSVFRDSILPILVLGFFCPLGFGPVPHQQLRAGRLLLDIYAWGLCVYMCTTSRMDNQPS